MAQSEPRFVLDLAQYRLLAGDEPVPLERQPMELLRLFVSRRGELVTRDDIVKELWPDGTYVSEDQSINRVIRRLRLALGDDSDTPRFIETVVGKGYRFVGAVEVRPATPPSSPVEVRQATPPTSPAPRRHYSRHLFTASLLLFGVSGWILYAIHAREASPLLPQPLTAYAGDEQYPSVSPGGDQVAFAWNGADRAHWDIYVKALGEAGAPLRLTTDTDEATETMPAWSPDGRWIAFERQSSTHFELRLISPLGGPERSIATGLVVRNEQDYSPPSWSADSHTMVVADFDPGSEGTRLVAV
ncbi:MAG TPA: winged helix-turn-helix domain-containing protein, partial [Vicinamibacterales bacterium]